MTKEQITIVCLLLDKYTKEREVYRDCYSKSIDETGIKNIKKELKLMID